MENVEDNYRTVIQIIPKQCFALQSKYYLFLGRTGLVISLHIIPSYLPKDLQHGQIGELRRGKPFMSRSIHPHKNKLFRTCNKHPFNSL